MTTAEIVPVQDVSALEALDPAAREIAVTQLLSDVRSQIALAVQMTASPEVIVEIKAKAAMAAEASKQLNMSKEIRDDAQEMVRRSEYALAKAIRKGQEEGSIGTQADNSRDASVPSTKASPSDFAKDVELYDRPSQGKAGILSLADNATPDEFEAALAKAKDEGNLSRANVARNIKGTKTDLTPVEKQGRAWVRQETRVEQIRAVADTGRTSSQIAAELGIGEEQVRKIAKSNGIEIVADRLLNGTRRSRIDSNHIVQETVTTLEGLASGLKLIDYGDLDPSQTANWAASLTDSIRALNRLNHKIKEMTQ